jgi:hypothetical protein
VIFIVDLYEKRDCKPEISGPSAPTREGRCIDCRLRIGDCGLPESANRRECQENNPQSPIIRAFARDRNSNPFLRDAPRRLQDHCLPKGLMTFWKIWYYALDPVIEVV